MGKYNLRSKTSTHKAIKSHLGKPEKSTIKKKHHVKQTSYSGFSITHEMSIKQFKKAIRKHRPHKHARVELMNVQCYLTIHTCIDRLEGKVNWIRTHPSKQQNMRYALSNIGVSYKHYNPRKMMKHNKVRVYSGQVCFLPKHT